MSDAAEFRAERDVERRQAADDLLQQYTDALIAAQASHDPWDWMAAGSIFKRYAAALAFVSEPQTRTDRS